NARGRGVHFIIGALQSTESYSNTEINEAAYTPRIVSIGPFHHGSERLQFMEAQKLRYLKKLIEREDKRLEDYVRLVKKLEERIHRCYGETYRNNLPLSSNDFLTMILVDVGFIIELLLRFNFYDLRDENEQLFELWIWRDLMHDLILLENQVPFFVLEEFFNLTFASCPDNFPSLLQFTLWVFKSRNEQNKLPNFEVRHFTDLIRTFYLPTSSRLSRSAGEEFKFLHSATELHEARVKFKVGSSKCLLDIKFKNGVLEMPCFELYDSTIAIIRNLMALELCNYFVDSYIIDYIVFMDYLINTPKDVDLLVRNGILVNGLGDSGAVATFFNNLCIEITFDNSNFYFSRLCEDLNAYYKVPMHMWKATLKRDYFSTPWRIASTIAATILLVLTFVQTVCFVKGI
ncbi:hypothetical protein F0562_007255, partial [Nyssa sinensis]